MNIDKRTGTIITIVLAVIFGCCALSSCLGGILTLAGVSEFTTTVGDVTQTGQTPPAYGLVGLCCGLIFVAIPVASYFLLVYKKNGAEAPAPPPM